MSRKTDAGVACTIGIDTGKNTLHLIGLDNHGAISPDSAHIAASHRSATNRLTRDEARRMAANFAKLPELGAA